MILWRYFHAGRVLCTPAVEKSALAKLRKSTGYSFSKCKEALEKHENNLKNAESWLREQAQAHGWEKATKLQGRATAQGLISVLSNSSNAVMVETNCETDFVARNKKFQTLVQKVTQGCFHFTSEQPGHTGNTLLSKIPLSSDQLANLPLGGSRPVKDETAISIGELGENIQNRRAVCFKAASPVILAAYTHPLPEGGVVANTVQFGRYGVIVAFRPAGDGSAKSQKNLSRLNDIGRQLCQHIVGMNPSEIGTLKLPERPVEPVEEPKKEEEKSANPDADGDDTEVKQLYPDIDESSLLNQEFLMDPDLTVGEFLLENGVEVLDFARFECGENIESSQHG